MERDFMSLNSKEDCVVVVKEEVVDPDCQVTGFGKSSGVLCPLSNKLSALPHFMSLKCEQDEEPSKNFGGATMKQQFPGWNLPSTEQWINSKVPAQLTIFYGGTVNIFDNISPEKAQAIMLLAGNGSVSSKLEVQALDQSGANNEVSKTMSTALIKKVEAPAPRMVSSINSVAATAMISSAVPQARRASLACFLEKRKQRAMSAAPYNLSKKAGGCASPESNGCGLSATSGVSTSKEMISGDI